MNNSDTNQAEQLRENAVMQSVILPTDLRIGNMTKQGIIKNFWERGVHVGFGKCYEFNELEPLILTEEALLNFGFKIDRQYQCDFASIGVFTISFGENFFYDYTNLKYVHQLQNLYYAITQRELTVA
ncbi:hypothetical protein [Flavobacterium sp.]|jgi:hypothetical protein|uniref:hypothetical protein n=1 Tax=Flavobacterium sp. TaxID=239 RepID=UPI0037C04BF9